MSIYRPVLPWISAALLLCLALRCTFLVLDDQSEALDSFLGKRVAFRGVVIEQPDESSGKQRLVVTLEGQLGPDSPYSEQVRVSTGVFPKFSYGDLISVEGVLEKPDDIVDEDSGRIFTYGKYLSVNDIYYTVSSAKVALLAAQQGNPIKRALLEFRDLLLHKIDELFPQPHGALVGGLLIGAKNGLGKELLDDFRRAGIIHVVVLSGFNVTIIAKGVMAVLSFLPRTASFLTGMAAIALFSIVAGASATVIRSSLMAIIALWAGLIRRDYDVVRALALAAILMALYEPRLVVYDPSFQLSFLATVGLIFLSPLVARRMSKIPEKFGMREIFAATISTQLFVLPYLLRSMGEISIVGLLVNILILPAIPLTMLASFLAIAAGFLHWYLALPFVTASYWLLEYELTIVDLFSHLSFASAKVLFFPDWLMWVCYIGYGFLFWRLYGKKN